MPVPPPLIGSYTPPSVRKGERVTCLLRDALCVVTATSSAPIPWPRVRALDHRGGSGLLVCPELVRAIRTESAVALKHWFGVCAGSVWRWRKTFGVGGRAATKGSRRAITSAARKGAEAVKQKVWSPAELIAKSVLSKRLGLRPPDRWKGKGWTPAQLALLGTANDKVIANRIGRSRGAVRRQRNLRGIPPFTE